MLLACDVCTLQAKFEGKIEKLKKSELAKLKVLERAISVFS